MSVLNDPREADYSKPGGLAEDPLMLGRTLRSEFDISLANACGQIEVRGLPRRFRRPFMADAPNVASRSLGTIRSRRGLTP